MGAELSLPRVDRLPIARPEESEESMMDVAHETVRMGSKQLEANRKMLETDSERLLHETGALTGNRCEQGRSERGALSRRARRSRRATAVR
jgi:hypothetical protein